MFSLTSASRPKSFTVLCPGQFCQHLASQNLPGSGVKLVRSDCFDGEEDVTHLPFQDYRDHRILEMSYGIPKYRINGLIHLYESLLTALSSLAGERNVDAVQAKLYILAELYNMSKHG